MPAPDENTVTVENLTTGELMEFTVKHETEESRWTTAAMNAAAAHWQEPERNLSIRSWVYGDPERHQNREQRAAAKIRYIDLTPTWSEAAQIIAAALENGTGTGREMARAELFRMAAILDDLKADQTAADEATFIVERTDNAGQRGTFLETRTVPHWTQDSQQADRLTQTDAERLADDWGAYARNKGLTATYAAIEAPEQEPQP